MIVPDRFWTSGSVILSFISTKKRKFKWSGKIEAGSTEQTCLPGMPCLTNKRINWRRSCLATCVTIYRFVLLDDFTATHLHFLSALWKIKSQVLKSTVLSVTIIALELSADGDYPHTVRLETYKGSFDKVWQDNKLAWVRKSKSTVRWTNGWPLTLHCLTLTQKGAELRLIVPFLLVEWSVGNDERFCVRRNLLRINTLTMLFLPIGSDFTLL